MEQGQLDTTVTEPDRRDHGVTLLLVEDDSTISDLLAYNLRKAGFEVRQEWNGRAGLEAALTGKYDLVLMDLMLPGLDGIAASREVKRHHPGLPVIILTARSEREMVLEGFQAGADDYVTKPFDMELLLARVAARLRERRANPPPEDEVRLRKELVLDKDTLAIRTPQGAAGLTPIEYALVSLLLANPGRLVLRDEIQEHVWRSQYSPGSRSLDVHVRRLRAKLVEIKAEAVIETVRGGGYRLVALPRPRNNPLHSINPSETQD